jgi:hypothetical protein
MVLPLFPVDYILIQGRYRPESIDRNSEFGEATTGSNGRLISNSMSDGVNI